MAIFLGPLCVKNLLSKILKWKTCISLRLFHDTVDYLLPLYVK